ncbi:MAG: LacI family DNA-binding transcriptional regulator [Akkermansiaceae bacterium]|nr:LacI family DNA-binding transcriptional regulator [Verrucomicrobiales bacterium]
MRVTLADIARRLGVSLTTVSMALHNNPRISSKTRNTVQQAAMEMGFQPDPFLAGLVAHRRQGGDAKFQGVLAWINHWDDPRRLRALGEFEAYWQGGEEAAKRLGYQLQEIRWPKGCPAKRIERILLARGINGILIPPHHHGVEWGDFDWSPFSLIRFGLSVRPPNSNLVTADHHRAIVMAMRKILEYGYRRIGLAMCQLYDDTLGGSFYGGFLWAQKHLQLPVVPPLKLDRHSSPKGIALFNEAFKKWMEKYRPEALITFYPEVPPLLRELGYRIPQDVAVAGTSMLDMPVDAGIDQHSRGIGRIAAEMLIKQVHANERGIPKHPYRVLVESRWQDGKSLPRLRPV